MGGRLPLIEPLTLRQFDLVPWTRISARRHVFSNLRQRFVALSTPAWWRRLGIMRARRSYFPVAAALWQE